MEKNEAQRGAVKISPPRTECGVGFAPSGSHLSSLRGRWLICVGTVANLWETAGKVGEAPHAAGRREVPVRPISKPGKETSVDHADHAMLNCRSRIEMQRRSLRPLKMPRQPEGQIFQSPGELR